MGVTFIVWWWHFTPETRIVIPLSDHVPRIKVSKRICVCSVYRPHATCHHPDLLPEICYCEDGKLSSILALPSLQIRKFNLTTNASLNLRYPLEKVVHEPTRARNATAIHWYSTLAAHHKSRQKGRGHCLLCSHFDARFRDTARLPIAYSPSHLPLRWLNRVRSIGVHVVVASLGRSLGARVRQPIHSYLEAVVVVHAAVCIPLFWKHVLPRISTL